MSIDQTHIAGYFQQPTTSLTQSPLGFGNQFSPNAHSTRVFIHDKRHNPADGPGTVDRFHHMPIEQPRRPAINFGNQQRFALAGQMLAPSFGSRFVNHEFQLGDEPYDVGHIFAASLSD